MAKRNYDEKVFHATATAGHEKLSFEEKQAGKYMVTFPYPYMNGYVHLGKLTLLFEA